MNGTFSKWKHEERETNFFESEDLWHKIAVDKKLRRRKFFGEDFETSFDE